MTPETPDPTTVIWTLAWTCGTIGCLLLLTGCAVGIGALLVWAIPVLSGNG